MELERDLAQEELADPREDPLCPTVLQLVEDLDRFPAVPGSRDVPPQDVVQLPRVTFRDCLGDELTVLGVLLEEVVDQPLRE